MSKITFKQITGLFSNRQNDTTNTLNQTDVRIETGWGVIAYAAAPTVSETVTFGTAFTIAPIVVICFGGDSPSGTTYGSGGNAVEGIVIAKAHTVTTSSFIAQLHKGSGANFVAGNGFYQWIAIGQ